MPGRYGLAVDIGTTTLAAQLIDLAHARVLASASRRNPQREVSDNVIGRIEAALAGQGAQLQQLVKDAIAKLTQEAATASQIDPNQVNAWVVTGNTTMLYLLTGRNPKLSHAPFESRTGRPMKPWRACICRPASVRLSARIPCAYCLRA